MKTLDTGSCRRTGETTFYGTINVVGLQMRKNLFFSNSIILMLKIKHGGIDAYPKI